MMASFDPTGAVFYLKLLKEFITLEFSYFALLLQRALRECSDFHGGNRFVQLYHDGAWLADPRHYQHLGLQVVVRYMEMRFTIGYMHI
jgi:hypothetical protein